MLLRILNLVPYPPVAPPFGDAGKVRASLSTLALKTVAYYASLTTKEFGAVWRALRKEYNDRANYDHACCKAPF